jgi:hypothetical protein
LACRRCLGRIRDEQSQQELKIKEVDTRIESEIAGLRTQIEQAKFSILQYLVGVATGAGALLVSATSTSVMLAMPLISASTFVSWPISACSSDTITQDGPREPLLLYNKYNVHTARFITSRCRHYHTLRRGRLDVKFSGRQLIVPSFQEPVFPDPSVFHPLTQTFLGFWKLCHRYTDRKGRRQGSCGRFAPTSRLCSPSQVYMEIISCGREIAHTQNL